MCERKLVADRGKEGTKNKLPQGQCYTSMLLYIVRLDLALSNMPERQKMAVYSFGLHGYLGMRTPLDWDEDKTM